MRLSNAVAQRLAEWDALARQRQQRRTALQKKRRDALRATGVTVQGKPYQKKKWQFKPL